MSRWTSSSLIRGYSASAEIPYIRKLFLPLSCKRCHSVNSIHSRQFVQDDELSFMLFSVILKGFGYHSTFVNGNPEEWKLAVNKCVDKSKPRRSHTCCNYLSRELSVEILKWAHMLQTTTCCHHSETFSSTLTCFLLGKRVSDLPSKTEKRLEDQRKMGGPRRCLAAGSKPPVTRIPPDAVHRILCQKRDEK